MKVLAASTALALALGLSTAASAQTGTRNLAPPAADAPRYEYCEVRIVGQDVYADFGYGAEKLGGPELSKLEVGKLQVFATPISALNYMGNLGWEVVQVVQETSTNQGGISIYKTGPSGNRYYVMRRLRSSAGVNVTR